MERIYEPEYIKILRRSQFREKDQVVKFAKNDGFNGQRITDSAFKKIDNVFIAVNDFIDKLYNKLEMAVIDKETEDRMDFGEIQASQIYSNNPISSENTSKIEPPPSSAQINFEDLNTLNEKLASLLLNKVSSSNKCLHHACRKNSYGLTQYETIQFKKSIVNLIHQMNKNFSL